MTFSPLPSLSSSPLPGSSLSLFNFPVQLLCCPHTLPFLLFLPGCWQAEAPQLQQTGHRGVERVLLFTLEQPLSQRGGQGGACQEMRHHSLTGTGRLVGGQSRGSAKPALWGLSGTIGMTRGSGLAVWGKGSFVWLTCRYIIPSSPSLPSRPLFSFIPTYFPSLHCDTSSL